MSDDTKDQAAEGKQMTAAEVAERVKRPVTEIEERKDRGGNVVKVPKVKRVAVDTDEVWTFRDHGTHVVVVTKDGQKFSSADE